MTENSLSEPQRQLVASLSERLSSVRGVLAVVFGGSHARGCARPDSDIDLGVLYRPSAPIDLEALRAIARDVNDTRAPVVSHFTTGGPG